MRRIMLSTALLMGGWVQAGTVQAGVYNLDPPRKYPSDYVMTNSPQPWWRTWDYLVDLRAVHDLAATDPKKPPGKDSLRNSYEKQLARLEERQQEGVLDMVDCVNLSACLIRLGRYGKAEQVLEKSLRLAPLDNPYRSLLLLHRAALYQQLAPDNDEIQQRALRFQEEGLQSWPALLPCWNRWESAWYRRVEQYTKTMMELRRRELINQQRGLARQMPTPDLLFPRDEREPAKKVRFVGESGKYEAGGIARNQMDRLPPDAHAIVLQLLFWRPNDHRLTWLCAELLNARGRVDEAFDLLDYLKKTGWQNAELDRHYRLLQNAVGPFKRLFVDKDATGEPQRLQASLLWALAPRGALLPPGLGVAANELGGWAASTYAGGGKNNNFPPPAPPAAQATKGNPLPDWRQLTVSFLTGVVVAVLGVLQWQQWRRNRRLASTLSTSTAEHFAPK